MPIPVTCESCSASFKVKDENAGKRAKCPKCGEPLTIPGASDAVKSPPAGKPVAAAKPRPVEDDDDRPTPKRRRQDEDADEPPKAKKRTDKANEKPKASRRRDDDEPKKKRSALPLILGILAGLVLLCGGGTAAVWFLVIVPAAEQAKANLASAFATVPGPVTIQQQPRPTGQQPPRTERPSPTPGPQLPPVIDGAVTKENLAKITAGMKLTEVQKLLGLGKHPSELEFAASVTSSDAATEERWKAKNQLNHVLMWRISPNAITIAFADAPSKGETTVVGVFGSFGFDSTETVKLPGGKDPSAPNPNAKPVDPKTLRGHPEATLTATQLAKDHAEYKDKWVVVTGKLKKDIPPLKEGEEPKWEDVVLDQQGLPIQFAGASIGAAGVKAGTEIEVCGKVAGLNFDESAVLLVESLCQKPAVEVEATALMDEFLKDKAAAIKKYEHQPLKVSGTVADIFGIVIAGSKTGDKGVQVHCDALKDKTLNLKPGDQVMILTNNLRFSRSEFNSCELWAGRVIAIKR